MRTILSLLVTKFRGMSAVRRGLAIAVMVCLMVLGQLSLPVFQKRSPSVAEFQQIENAPPETSLLDATTRMDAEKQFSDAKLQGNESRSTSDLAGGSPYGVPMPLIAHSAELAVATKEFTKSRSSLEEILERHRGYAAKLRMAGRHTGSVLSATLRVPSSELGATVSELKSLGEVEQEAQSADEVTQQHADLEARLANARAALRRLQELLQKQTYPDGNVRELQRQIANASAEVNRLEAERTAAEHRVTFAHVQFSMREVLAQPEESLVAQLHAAAATGFGEAASSLSAILLFLIGRGPVALLWMVILYFPARLIWRRLRVAPVATAVQG